MTQDSVTDMCWYLAFEAHHPCNEAVHGGNPGLSGVWCIWRNKCKYWTVLRFPNKFSPRPTPLRNTKVGKDEENRERFSQKACVFSSSPLSCFSAAALLVEFDFVLEAVVQFEVVVLQSGGGSWRESAVGARAVQEEAGAHRPEQDAQGAHDDDRDQDGVQSV